MNPGAEATAGREHASGLAHRNGEPLVKVIGDPCTSDSQNAGNTGRTGQPGRRRATLATTVGRHQASSASQPPEEWSWVDRVVGRIAQAEVQLRAAVPHHLTAGNHISPAHDGRLQHSVCCSQPVGLQHHHVASAGHHARKRDHTRSDRTEVGSGCKAVLHSPVTGTVRTRRLNIGHRDLGCDGWRVARCEGGCDQQPQDHVGPERARRRPWLPDATAGATRPWCGSERPGFR